MTAFVMALTGNLAEACTPSAGMGCYPCCGVDSSTTAVAQTGNMGLGAAALLVVGFLLWKFLTSKSGRG